MATDDSSCAAGRGKPAINATLDHISIASAPSGISVCITLTIVLDDMQALDAVMRVIGTLSRSKGVSDAGCGR